MNFDKANQEVDRLILAEQDASELIALMLIADGAPVSDGPTPEQAQAELRKRGLL